MLLCKTCIEENNITSYSELSDPYCSCTEAYENGPEGLQPRCNICKKYSSQPQVGTS